MNSHAQLVAVTEIKLCSNYGYWVMEIFTVETRYF